MILLDVIEHTVERVEPTLEGLAAFADATTARLEELERRVARLLELAEAGVGPLEELAAFAAEGRATAAAFAESPIGKMLSRKQAKAAREDNGA